MHPPQSPSPLSLSILLVKCQCCGLTLTTELASAKSFTLYTSTPHLTVLFHKDMSTCTHLHPCPPSLPPPPPPRPGAGMAGWCTLVSKAAQTESQHACVMQVRFANIVIPGDELCTQLWHTGPGQFAFQVKNLTRKTIAIANGKAAVDPEQDPPSKL